MHDLKQFCLLTEIPLYIVHDNPDEVNNISIDDLPLCFTLWRRYYGNKKLNNIELLQKMVPFLSTDITTISRKVHFIFGLLTVEERTQFIERYILDNA